MQAVERTTRVVSHNRSRPRHRAEPLAASWNPEVDPESDDDLDIDEPERPRRREGGVLGRYGWRIYALPLLVVISVLAVMQTANPSRPSQTTAGSDGGRSQAPNVPEAPVVTEAPPGQTYDPAKFSAELPAGSPVPEFGARTFELIPGTSPEIGQGKLYQYTIEIETGVRLAEGNDSYANLVQETLSDPRSWTNPQGGGIALQRVDVAGPRPDFRVTLVSQNTAREICGYGNGLPFDTSCRIGDRVYINAARWVRGAISFEGDYGTYRRYAINHEVGHVFGNGHVGCGQQGALAPVMMQQTFSVSNDELHELNKAVPQGTKIPANGLVCRYSAWPFPVGAL